MNKKGWFVLWIVIVLVATGLIDFAILRTRNFDGKQIGFTVGDGTKIVVRAQEEITVSAAGKTYFRISDGRNELAGEPVTQGYYTAKGKLSPGRWKVWEALSTELYLSSEEAMTATVNPSTNARRSTIFYSLLLAGASIAMGAVIAFVE